MQDNETALPTLETLLILCIVFLLPAVGFLLEVGRDPVLMRKNAQIEALQDSVRILKIEVERLGGDSLGLNK